MASLRQTIENWDHAVMRRVPSWRNKPSTSFLTIITYSGTSPAWFGLALLLIVTTRAGIDVLPEQALFLRCMQAALFAWIAGWLLKRVFRRKRPSQALEAYETAVPPPPCGSFPSSHAAASVALFAALVLFAHPLAWAAGLWAGLVVFSRLYLGVHFPTDLLGGSALGVLCALLLRALTS
jgi:undecaprenyl-diphosphatase